MGTDEKVSNAIWWRQCDWLLYFPRSIFGVIQFISTGSPVYKTQDAVLSEWELDAATETRESIKPKTQRRNTKHTRKKR